MFGIQKNRYNRNRINNYSRSILMSPDSTLTHTQKSAMMSFTTDSVRSLSAKRTSFCTRNEALLLATSSLKSFSNCSKTIVINVSIKRKQIYPGCLNCSKFVNKLYTIVILIENNQYIRPRVQRSLNLEISKSLIRPDITSLQKSQVTFFRIKLHVYIAHCPFKTKNNHSQCMYIESCCFIYI